MPSGIRPPGEPGTVLPPGRTIGNRLTMCMLGDAYQPSCLAIHFVAPYGSWMPTTSASARRIALITASSVDSDAPYWMLKVITFRRIGADPAAAGLTSDEGALSAIITKSATNAVRTRAFCHPPRSPSTTSCGRCRLPPS